MHTLTAPTNHDPDKLANEARALMAATADLAEAGVTEARARLAAALDSGRRTVGRVRDQAVHRAEAASLVIHRHPYQAIAIGIGLAVVATFLLSRSCGRNRG